MNPYAHVYDDGFYSWVDRTAERSARAVIPVVAELLRPKSVLDVGCGRGIWLAVWQSESVHDVAGIDGDYVDRSALAIPADCFIATDLTRPFDLGRKFDLVESLEVAEHLPEAAADRFVASLALHGDAILFSAAQPGQGGEHHINEQRPEYWRTKFGRFGYRMFDPVRPLVAKSGQVDPWYKYNTFLFLRGAAVDTHAQRLSGSEITDLADVPDPAPISWRFRRALLRSLPRGAVTRLSRIRYRVHNVLSG